MVNVALIRTIDKEICHLINSNDGLWRTIGELSRTMEYVLNEDPLKKLSCQLDVIEKHMGESDRTKELRKLFSSNVLFHQIIFITQAQYAGNRDR